MKEFDGLEGRDRIRAGTNPRDRHIASVLLLCRFIGTEVLAKHGDSYVVVQRETIVPSAFAVVTA